MVSTTSLNQGNSSVAVYSEEFRRYLRLLDKKETSKMAIHVYGSNLHPRLQESYLNAFVQENPATVQQCVDIAERIELARPIPISNPGNVRQQTPTNVERMLQELTKRGTALTPLGLERYAVSGTLSTTVHVPRYLDHAQYRSVPSYIFSY